MNQLQVKDCSFTGWHTPDAGFCAWIADMVTHGRVLLWNEEIVRDLMLAGY